MFSPALWIAVLCCLAADAVLLRNYTKVTDARRNFYGNVRYYGHVYVMKGFVYLGMVGLVCEVIGWKTFLPYSYIGQLMGCLAILATPFTLAMAFKAYGDRSLTTSGYQLYTIFFFRSGIMAYLDPSSEVAWVQCWLLAHSYATCRIFTSLLWQLRQGLKTVNVMPKGMVYSHKQAYNYALVLASCIVLYVTEGSRSLGYYIFMSMLVQLALYVLPVSLDDISPQHTFKNIYVQRLGK